MEEELIKLKSEMKVKMEQQLVDHKKQIELDAQVSIAAAEALMKKQMKRNKM